MPADQITIDLDAIRARLETATPGPWHLETAGTPAGETAWGEVILRHHPASGAGTPIPGLRVMWGGEVAVGRRNATFIAAAPTDISALLAECRVLRAENNRLRILAAITAITATVTANGCEDCHGPTVHAQERWACLDCGRHGGVAGVAP